MPVSRVRADGVVQIIPDQTLKVPVSVAAASGFVLRVIAEMQQRIGVFVRHQRHIAAQDHQALIKGQR